MVVRIEQLLTVVTPAWWHTVSAFVHFIPWLYGVRPVSAALLAYSSMFTFAMLMLVTADNLVQLFFGWEGVGLASYLLIGFWYHKPEANAAAIKAFVVNRVGDFGFALGFLRCSCWSAASTSTLYSRRRRRLWARRCRCSHGIHDALTITCLLLFMGAMGKSGNFYCIHGCPTPWRARRRYRR